MLMNSIEMKEHLYYYIVILKSIGILERDGQLLDHSVCLVPLKFVCITNLFYESAQQDVNIVKITSQVARHHRFAMKLTLKDCLQQKIQGKHPIIQTLSMFLGTFLKHKFQGKFFFFKKKTCSGFSACWSLLYPTVALIHNFYLLFCFRKYLFGDTVSPTDYSAKKTSLDFTR